MTHITKVTVVMITKITKIIKTVTITEKCAVSLVSQLRAVADAFRSLRTH